MAIANIFNRSKYFWFYVLSFSQKDDIVGVVWRVVKRICNIRMKLTRLSGSLFMTFAYKTKWIIFNFTIKIHESLLF